MENEKKWTRLIEARKANRMTQQELADKCGVNQSTYVRWENLTFRPNINQLKTLSMVLRVPIDFLVYNDEFDVGDLEYWIQLANAKDTLRQFLANNPAILGQFQTKEGLLDYLTSSYAPGPYSLNPDAIQSHATTDPDDDPFKASIFDVKKP